MCYINSAALGLAALGSAYCYGLDAIQPFAESVAIVDADYDALAVYQGQFECVLTAPYVSRLSCKRIPADTPTPEFAEGDNLPYLC